jgi:ferrous iron transport protein B
MKVAIVGSPNVGKSATFNALTGRYVAVSNYPGTTVEVARARGRAGGLKAEIIDTPGLYDLLPITEEERVARTIILADDIDAVVHVVDAKNLERMLPLTIQLLEMRLPVVIAVNMMDDAEREGLAIDIEGLAQRLGAPVVATVATSRRGLEELELAIVDTALERAPAVDWCRYDADIDAAVDDVAARLSRHHSARAHAVARLLLAGDDELRQGLEAADPETHNLVLDAAAALEAEGDTIALRFACRRHEASRRLLRPLVSGGEGSARRLSSRISAALVRPVTGIPILLLVLYLGLYQFVGRFGAGEVVDFVEGRIFGAHIIPWINSLIDSLFGTEGWEYWARELIVGDYGIITLGVTYAIAIVLPIVFLFFLFFSLLEDSGYFPRLALLTDRSFKRIGLNGRAVIPVVLGFACDTMATMVTRVQETRRERVITTALLALAIPCSAQYGVMAAMLADASSTGPFGVSVPFLIWAGVVGLVFLATGLIASRVVSGERASFYMELPPLRMPQPGNVLIKTFARMKWYFLEILPLFVLASVLIWIGRLTGLFELIIRGLEPVVGAIGLPDAAAPAFLYGFFRRDFGAAGLFDLAETGAMSMEQVLVACVTLTLFLPCVAQLLIMHRERGPRTTAILAGVVVVVAFGVGGALNGILTLTGGL